MFKGKRILMTGGSGFLARTLIPKIKGDVLCVARNESKLLEVKEQFGVDIMSGDISDRGFVQKIMKDVDAVFHLAGSKHIDISEVQSEMTVNTNIVGSKNILDASQYQNLDFVIATSTDKAYSPYNCYGMTKRIMEYLFAEYDRNNPKCKYRIARYGNVANSSASVIPKWQEAVKLGKPIKITVPEMTRFYFTADDAVQTLFDCLEKSTDATPFIPKMKAIVLKDLAEAVAGKDYPMEIIGNRGNEKLHEGLSDNYKSDTVEKYTIQEIKDIFL